MTARALKERKPHKMEVVKTIEEGSNQLVLQQARNIVERPVGGIVIEELIKMVQDLHISQVIRDKGHPPMDQ